MNLNKYHQPSPDINEGIPERVDRSPELRKAKTAIMSMLPAVPEAKPAVLDIGPACGWEAIKLTTFYGKGTVTAITLFKEEADQLKANVENLAGIHVGDMHEMPDNWTAKYHVAFASHVLEHSPAPYIALCEIFRVMRAKGRIMIVLPNADGYTGLGSPKPRRLGRMPAHLFVPSIETMIEMAKHAGFAFGSYREVLQICDGQIHYINRIFMLEKP